MKTPIIILLLGATLVVFTGCSPKYRGEGQMTNTTTWYMIFRQPEYTIRLPSFGLNTNITQECKLGDVAFFRKTEISVSLQFIDDQGYQWQSFRELYSEGTFLGDYILANSKFQRRDTDKIQGRLSFRVVTETGKELLRCDKPLKDYHWAQDSLHPEKGYRVILSDWPLTSANIVKGMKLKLLFSYSGDPSLTNRGELVVECQPR